MAYNGVCTGSLLLTVAARLNATDSQYEGGAAWPESVGYDHAAHHAGDSNADTELIATTQELPANTSVAISVSAAPKATTLEILNLRLRTKNIIRSSVA